MTVPCPPPRGATQHNRTRGLDLTPMSETRQGFRRDIEQPLPLLFQQSWTGPTVSAHPCRGHAVILSFASSEERNDASPSHPHNPPQSGRSTRDGPVVYDRS